MKADGLGGPEVFSRCLAKLWPKFAVCCAKQIPYTRIFKERIIPGILQFYIKNFSKFLQTQ